MAVYTCDTCGTMTTGAYFPKAIKPANKPWTSRDYDRYDGPTYCSAAHRDEAKNVVIVPTEDLEAPRYWEH